MNFESLIDPKWKPHLEALPADSLTWTVRAWNCIKQQGCKTLWDIAKRSEHDWLKASNFGRKSLALVKEELQRFVGALEMQGIAAAQVTIPQTISESPEQLVRKWLEHCVPRRMPEAVWRIVVGDLIQTDASSESVGAIASRIGAKWPHNRYHEPLANFLKPSIQALAVKTGLGKAKLGTVFQCAIAKWGDIHNLPLYTSRRGQDGAAVFSTDVTMAALADSMQRIFKLARLTEKERHVLEDRYGLSSDKAKTLEEVGQHFKLTRERIRQIQIKAYEKIIGSNDLRDLLTRWLESLEPELLSRLSPSVPGFVKECSETEMLSAAGGWGGLLIELLFPDVETWLNKNAERTKSGWVYGEVTATQLASAATKLTSYFEDCPLPVPLAAVSRETGLAENVLRIAAAHDAVWISGDFLSGRRLGAGQERVVAAHVKTRNAKLPLLDRNLMPQLLFPENCHNSPSASIVYHDVRSMPSLLIACGSAHVLRISPNWECAHTDLLPAISPRAPRQYDEAQDDIDDPNPEEQTLFEFGMQIMRSRKVWRVNEFQEAFSKRANGRFAANSATAIFSAHVVQRFAPGIWGCRETKVDASDYETLLRSEDCELYVEARRAQSQLCEFPMWNPEMELRWCRWARDQKEHENLYQSLLSIINPDDWPCPEPIRDQWKERKKKQGRYRLAHSPHSALAQLPVVPHEILASVGAVIGRRGISWMDLNVVHGRILNSHRCAPYLALLIALEVLQPASHWQEFHSVGPQAAKVFQDLCGLWSRGKTDAVTDRVHALATAYAQSEGNLGWVTTVELTSLLNVLGHVAPINADKEMP